RRATAEVVEWLRRRHLICEDRFVLDIGCGIGRLEEALAPEVARIVGLDISGQMIAIAKERCRGLPNVSLLVSSGRDLSMIDSDAMDLVVAVDVFPYLVQAGSKLASVHIEEASRVLKPSGSLLILNFSYRGNAEADRGDISRAAAAAKFTMTVVGTRPFKHWDGTAYLLVKSR